MKTRESPKQRQLRAQKIISALGREYPNPKIALEYSNPLELLVAVILSAQCTDTRVNMVTKDLFRRYRTAADYADANPAEFEEEIRSTGFFRNKAKSIIAACKAIVERHGGKVPSTMEELTALAGVGRKTANCVLGGAFGINSGIIVDTHVKRLAGRLGLSAEGDPEKIERDLMGLVPRKKWYDFGNMLIWHGRKVCAARKPKCPECVLQKFCPAAGGFLRKFWK